MNNRYALRAATDKDIDFIFNLRVETMKEQFEKTLGWDNDMQYQAASDKIEHAEIIVLENKDIGVIKVVPEKQKLELHQVQIMPEFQGTGIGTEVVAGLLEKADRENSPVALFVLNNSPAKRLYTRLGFTVTEEYEHNCRMIRLPVA